MKRLDAKYSHIESSVGVEKFSKRAFGNIAAAGESDVWMKRALLGFKTRLERGFLHALVNLEEMRMTGADSDPDDFRRTFRGKFSETENRKEKCFELDRAEFFAQPKINIFRHAFEKA